MSRAGTFIRLLVVLTCVWPLFSAAGADRYRVTLVLDPGDNAALIAKRLAAAYHGQLETPVDDTGTFLITLCAATASLLSHDPHVARIVAPDAATTWASGTYEYDHAGNIKKIGTSGFVYDQESRLAYEKAGTQTRQALTYDGFGNVRSITEGSSAFTVGARASSNRADVPSSSVNHLYGTYDGAGNMITSAANTYAYDALNVMTRSTTDVSRAYVYNVNDERIGVIVLSAPNGAEVSSQWTIRDPAGQVLRRFSRQGTEWRWMQDYIYRDGKMLAAGSNDQIKTLHYHLDHLGTPRLITGNGGVEVARHTYYPFGEELPGVTPQVAEPKKFTGHERDGGRLDYMHARYYDYGMGRFLSVDPGPSDLRRPQTWNRYVYAENNPSNRIDPDGRLTNPVTKEVGKGIPILHRGGRVGQIRELRPSVKASAGGEYGAARSGSRTHKGVDIVAPVGTPLVAAFSGTAEVRPEYDKDGKQNKLGLTVVVFGKDGTTAMYAHLSGTDVKTGDKIKGRARGRRGGKKWERHDGSAGERRSRSLPAVPRERADRS